VPLLPGTARESLRARNIVDGEVLEALLVELLEDCLVGLEDCRGGEVGRLRGGRGLMLFCVGFEKGAALTAEAGHGGLRTSRRCCTVTSFFCLSSSAGRSQHKKNTKESVNTPRISRYDSPHVAAMHCHPPYMQASPAAVNMPLPVVIPSHPP